MLKIPINVTFPAPALALIAVGGMFVGGGIVMLATKTKVSLPPETIQTLRAL
jgi:xanthosine utilization system XapX-like protein